MQVPDNRTPGEYALWLSAEGGSGVLILEDALIGKPPGSLNLLPADKYRDVRKAHGPAGYNADGVGWIFREGQGNKQEDINV